MTPVARWCRCALAAALLATAPAATALAESRTVDSQAGPLVVEQLADGLDHPWGMAFLPDGDLLVTERAGRLRILGADGRLSDPLAGVPEVYASGQGGLLDVALDPGFESSRLVYLSYAEEGEGGAGTALGRGRLEQGGLAGFEVIFRQQPKVEGSKHFGGRIAFAPDGTLFLTLGERFGFEPAQDPSNALGAVVRLNPDGSIPEDNPFAGGGEGAPEVWSYGHRNVEAATVDPESGALWIAEMGPRGGDELNRPEAGRNHGWPEVSWGKHYSGQPIPDPPSRPELADALLSWTPVISPSGMVLYNGELFPDWQGSLLIGGLSARALVRVALEGGEPIEAERLELRSRIRDVEQAPDGSVYLLTDESDGKVLRLVPQG